MELSASAKEFRPGQPCGETGFDIKDHDFPVIGSGKQVVDRERYWFQEESLNPILKRNIDGLREETEDLTSKLKDSQGNIKELEDRNSWLEWNKKRFKERIEEHKSKIVSLEDTIQDHKEKGSEMESDLKYYKVRLEKADIELRTARIRSDQKSHQIDDIQERLRRTERDLRDRSLQWEQQVATNRERESSNEKWIGCTLKLKFIFGEIEKIGALPEDHAEWVMAMVDSIEMPPVSVRVRNQFLPSYDDAHMVDVEPEIESERIAEWSREAAIFSDQLGEHLIEQLTQNQSSTIKLIITIQKFARGFILRRSHQTLYGGNLVEKVASATLIQKIYRGFKVRGIRFYEPRSMHAMWLTTRSFEHRASRRRGVRFINTGPLPFKFAWVRSDGTFSNPTLIAGKTLGRGLAMSTFVSHWFAIYPHNDDEVQPTRIRGWGDEEQSGVRYIRVNYAFTSNGFFDVHTGMSLSQQDWEQRRSLSDGGYLPDYTDRPRLWPNAPPGVRPYFGQAVSQYSSPAALSIGCDCETCQARRQEDDDEARLQLAIQLSLDDTTATDPGDGDNEEVTMITDDAPNYDIDVMFNLINIIQLSPGEMITDDAPNYDIDVMFNSIPEEMITDDIYHPVFSQRW
jgi:hypothetical protein